MKQYIITIFLLFLFNLPVLAQRTEKVRAEYIYYAPDNISLDEAKKIALERAKIQCIANEFGTFVTQTNTTLVSNVNGVSSTDFFSMGGSEVRGEWIEDIGLPEYVISYDKGVLVVKVLLSGRIREIKGSQIDIKAEVLCNGTELKFASTDFKSGDDLYLYFKSPADGYLAVYLLDEVSQMVYCLLPYKNSVEAVTPVVHDKSYTFFSAQCADSNPHFVDEYTMTSNASIERNTMYIVFSQNEFIKANSNDSAELLPMELTFSEFQKWMNKVRSRDSKMMILNKHLTITQ